MHRRAEYGVAAHWKYKESAKSAPAGTDAAGNDMAWLRQLVDWQKETADPQRVPRLAAVRDRRRRGLRLHAQGRRHRRCRRARRPVDFAYAVHTEVGHRTMGARVNGRLVPLDSTLENGDVVEVFTSKSETAGPSRDWLGFVKSPRARNKIRQWFSKERREEAIEHGKDAIAKAMRKQNLPIQRLLSHESLVALAQRDALRGRLRRCTPRSARARSSAATVVQRLVQSMGGETGAEEDLAEVARPGQHAAPRAHGRPGRRRQGRRRHLGQARQVLHPGARATTSSASSPAAPGVSVHRTDCINVDEPARPSPSAWSTSSGRQTSSSLFLVQIQVEALDRSRLLSDVTRVLSDHHVNILSASVSTSRDRVALSRFVFEMAEPVAPRVRARGGPQGRGRLRRLPDHRRQGRRRPGHPGLTGSASAPARRRASAAPAREAARASQAARAPAQAVEPALSARRGSNPAREQRLEQAQRLPGAAATGRRRARCAATVVTRTAPSRTTSSGGERRTPRSPAAGAGRRAGARAARRARRPAAAGAAGVQPDRAPPADDARARARASAIATGPQRRRRRRGRRRPRRRPTAAARRRRRRRPPPRGGADVGAPQRLGRAATGR